MRVMVIPAGPAKKALEKRSSDKRSFSSACLRSVISRTTDTEPMIWPLASLTGAALT
jgi:hypothetical protein